MNILYGGRIPLPGSAHHFELGYKWWNAVDGMAVKNKNLGLFSFIIGIYKYIFLFQISSIRRKISKNHICLLNIPYPIIPHLVNVKLEKLSS
jgi:hypothetical protein